MKNAVKKGAVFATLFAIAISAVAAFSWKKTITGYIQIYGSAPHTFVGFITDDGKQYSLDIDSDAKFSMNDISAHQGEQLKLTGIINQKELIGFQTLRDGRFVVSKFKTTGKAAPNNSDFSF